MVKFLLIGHFYFVQISRFIIYAPRSLRGRGFIWPPAPPVIFQALSIISFTPCVADTLIYHADSCMESYSNNYECREVFDPDPMGHP